MAWINFAAPVQRPLQKLSHPFMRGAQKERWPSGLRRTLGKRVCGKPYRGFESHSLRQPLNARDAPTQAIACFKELEIDARLVQPTCRDEAGETASNDGNLGIHQGAPRTEISACGIQGGASRTHSPWERRPYADGNRSIESKTRAV